MVSFNRGAIICTTQNIEHKLGWYVQHTTQGYTYMFNMHEAIYTYVHHDAT